MGELIVKGKEVVALTQNGGLDKVIKPLTKQIHLFDTFIAGVSHLEDKTVLQEIAVKDKLTLRREDNKFDAKAIIIFSANGKKLGYIPEKDNVIFSRLMDVGKMLVAYITEINKKSENYYQINIGIYLVDF